MNNQLRIKASIDIVRWVTFQACAFRGHNERSESKNRGNFLKMMKLLVSYNEQVCALLLGNAPQNAKYTSHQIQKEILHVFARNVQSLIRHEIGDARFCLIVDEARDESRREQMSIVIRFVDRSGFIRERFLDIVINIVSASCKRNDVHTFCYNLIFVINIVSTYCKRNDELQAFQSVTIEHLVDIGEIEMGKGVNQVGGLQ